MTSKSDSKAVLRRKLEISIPTTIYYTWATSHPPKKLPNLTFFWTCFQIPFKSPLFRSGTPLIGNLVPKCLKIGLLFRRQTALDFSPIHPTWFFEVLPCQNQHMPCLCSGFWTKSSICDACAADFRPKGVFDRIWSVKTTKKVPKISKFHQKYR